MPPRWAKFSACLALIITAFFGGWWLWFPAPSLQYKSYQGNMIYWMQNPSARPMEPDYTLSFFFLRVPFEGIIYFAGLWAVFMGLFCIAAYFDGDGPKSSGLCAACGYDLRATPDRCPECGKIPKILERKSN